MPIFGRAGVSGIFWMAAWIAAVLLGSTKPVDAGVDLPSAEQVESFIRAKIVEPNDSDDPLDEAFEVLGVRPSPLGGFFKGHRLFEVYVSGFLLESKILPGGGSTGLFATDGTQISHLNPKDPQGLELIMRRAHVTLDGVDAKALSELFSEALLRNGNFSHTVIASASDIFQMTTADSNYVLDPAERPKYESSIRAPRITGTRSTGWMLEFFTLAGWMHESTIVTRQVVEISSTYQIDRREKILTRRAFLQVPDIVY